MKSKPSPNLRTPTAPIPAAPRKLDSMPSSPLSELQRRLAPPALTAALNLLEGEAFVIGTADLVVFEANGAGKTALRASRTATLSRIAAALGGAMPSSAVVSRFRLRGSDFYALVFFKNGADLPAAAHPPWTLTRRQRQVMEALERGLTTREIATSLDCAPKTVEKHVTGLLRRAGCRSRGALIATLNRLRPQ